MFTRLLKLEGANVIVSDLLNSRLKLAANSAQSGCAIRRRNKNQPTKSKLFQTLFNE